MRIALFGKTYKPEHREAIQLLFDELKINQAKIIIFNSFLDKIKDQININPDIETFTHHKDLKEKVDYLFSIGGDGTLLDTIKYVQDSGIPILGINLGRMGFLSSISKDQIKEAIQQVKAGEYIIDKRALLHLEKPEGLFGERNYALNELSIIRSASAAMLTIKTYINGDYMNSYLGDGLIVATPQCPDPAFYSITGEQYFLQAYKAVNSLFFPLRSEKY